MQEQIEMTIPRVDPPSVEIVEIGCGCRYEVDPLDQAPAMVLSMCAEHDARSTAIDDKMRRAMGLELDVYVANAAGGKRVQRIMPVDPYRGR